MAEIEAFIERWKRSGAAERSNFQLFMSELCDALNVPRPDPAKENESENEYVFERAVRFRHDDGTQTIGRIDLYRRGAFVLEGKQSRKREEDPRTRELVQLGLELGEASFTRTGAGKREGRGWDTVMAAAKQQAESYAKALPKEDGWPPFIIVVDVGNIIEVYADFSLQGKHYAQFPDRQGYRIALDDLKRSEIQERLQSIWLDPLSLDPSRRTAEVTREIAALLAKLSQSLEKRGYNAGSVATFLMRCLFTMFAEDVGLLRQKAFQELLERHVGKADQLHLALPHLWREMNDGGFSPTLGEKLLRFNGGLFHDTSAVPLDEQDLNWLILAAKREWTNVEPAIFGTLLERALDTKERHKLGAHYTPRAYVERLVVPTIIEPLTEDWRAVQAEAADFLKHGEKERALGAVKAFHRKLCNTRVLDPACGTGNFLYVSMELMKRLEGEVLELLSDLGDGQYLLELDRHTVDPHQFLGLEINPRAVAIAELVLWIGYLQWHFRTRGRVMPAEPVLKAFANIKEQDAVLAYDKQEILRDDKGHPLTRWDGVTKKLHPITGEEIPDPDAQMPLYKYVNPRPANWPEADFVVGNPPFMANRNFREELGDGYTDALSHAYSSARNPIDLVVYFWIQAATKLNPSQGARVGLISTSRVRMRQNATELGRALGNRWRILFAIPDHEWPSEKDNAKVRVSFIVAGEDTDGKVSLLLAPDHDTVRSAASRSMAYQSVFLDKIEPDLSPQVSIAGIRDLEANSRLTHAGVKPYAKKLLVSGTTRTRLFENASDRERFAPKILNGQDIQRDRGLYALDFYGYSLKEIGQRFPAAYQYLLDYVKPERSQERNSRLREEFWLFEANRPTLREALVGLTRYIVTLENSPNRYFLFLNGDVLPDQKLRVVASDDAYILGVLSSMFHTAFADRVGGRAGIANTPVYNSPCLQQFPFPLATGDAESRIRALGERLDAFRKERLAEHKSLTMTKLYNVLEKLRRCEALDEKDKTIHEMGLVSVLKNIHDELDQAVADAYGWPRDLTDEQILERLVALNKERAAEERKGLVRWLRPEFQAPKEALRKPQQVEAELVAAEEVAGKPSFPKDAPDQVAAVRAMLTAEGKPIKAGELARKFKQGKRVEPRVRDLLQIMAAIGQAQTENGSRYFAAR